MKIARSVHIPYGYYQLALEKFGFRQKAYKQAFPPGSPAYLAFVDLAVYCCVFDDQPMSNLSNDQIRELHGRRQAFFRIWKQMNLDPKELESVFHGAVQRTAQILYLAEKGE